MQTPSRSVYKIENVWVLVVAATVAAVFEIKVHRFGQCALLLRESYWLQLSVNIQMCTCVKSMFVAALVSLVPPNSIDLTNFLFLWFYVCFYFCLFSSVQFGFSCRFVRFSIEFLTFIYFGLCVPSHSGNRIDVRTKIGNLFHVFLWFALILLWNFLLAGWLAGSVS